MSTSPEVLNIRLSIIKDRHQACPKVNYIVHSTSILYGIRIIISLIMHSNNSSNRHTETAVRYPAVSSLFKVGRFHGPRENGMFARIQGRNPFVRNIYKRRTGKL